MNERQWKRFEELHGKMKDLAMEFENVGIYLAAGKLWALTEEINQTPGDQLTKKLPKPVEQVSESRPA